MDQLGSAFCAGEHCHPLRSKNWPAPVTWRPGAGDGKCQGRPAGAGFFIAGFVRQLRHVELVSGTESRLDGFLGHLVRTLPDGDARFAGFAG